MQLLFFRFLLHLRLFYIEIHIHYDRLLTRLTFFEQAFLYKPERLI
jgi:hypothetical protein